MTTLGWLIERAARPSQEALHEVGVLGQVASQHLYGDAVLQEGVPRSVDAAHRSQTDESLDVVQTVESKADERFRVVRERFSVLRAHEDERAVSRVATRTDLAVAADRAARDRAFVDPLRREGRRVVERKAVGPIVRVEQRFELAQERGVVRGGLA